MSMSARLIGTKLCPDIQSSQRMYPNDFLFSSNIKLFEVTYILNYWMDCHDMLYMLY